MIDNIAGKHTSIQKVYLLEANNKNHVKQVDKFSSDSFFLKEASFCFELFDNFHRPICTEMSEKILNILKKRTDIYVEILFEPQEKKINETKLTPEAKAIIETITGIESLRNKGK